MKEGAVFLQMIPQFLGVDQVSVVGQSQSSLYIVQHQRLGVDQSGGSCGGVPHMSDSQIAMEAVEVFFFKYLADQSHAFVGINISLRSFGVAYGNAAGLLPSVLESRESIVDRRRYVISGKVIDTENAAGFFDFILCIQFHLE